VEDHGDGLRQGKSAHLQGDRRRLLVVHERAPKKLLGFWRFVRARLVHGLPDV
jgi:hypothetical protein